ncbi:Leucine aminopeptidase 2 [Nymphon striatum]|nr:Leucine aminopeptidase 2 [Nymphon striatum]
MTHAQHQDKVDFINGTAMTVLNPKEKSIDGKIAYSYNILKQVDSIFLDAINMEFSEVTINEKKVDYSYDGKKIAIFSKFEKGQSDTLSLTYKVTPKQTVYFSGWNDEIEGNEQVWTQGQGKYTSHWLPSFDDMEEKVEFDLYFMVDGENDYTILSNGILKEKGDFMGTSIWLYDMSQPMSSYLVSFAIGNYKKRELKSKSGISIENYYYPQDSLKVEPTYRYTKEIFDFLEEEIGVPYPWQNYKQIPVRDFLYAGMENTTATIFSDGYVIDSTAFVDKNYVNVNAHELAHQWFGNLVTEKNGNHHWLHEGFATYLCPIRLEKSYLEMITIIGNYTAR